MFFTLSKILYYLITPGFWIWVCIIIGIIRRKKNFHFLWAAIFLLLVFTNPYLFRKAMIAYQTKPVVLKEKPGQPYTAILLTGFVKFDSAGQGYFGKASDRYVQTIQLYQQHIIDKIIISGGSGNLWLQEPPEALFLQNELKKLGVPDSLIAIDTLSRNTFENGQFTRQLLDSIGWKGPYLLITSASHLPRAKKVMDHFSIPTIAYPCNYIEIPQKNTWQNTLYPDFSKIADWEYLIKEIVGTWVYQITGKA
ncbi:MAG: YdcF family protein [Sediminibacterium sp.]|nr:YdcF family protein [Sediminibacterium sp.]